MTARLLKPLFVSACAIAGGYGLGWLISAGLAHLGVQASPLACWLALVTADAPLRRLSEERRRG